MHTQSEVDMQQRAEALGQAVKFLVNMDVEPEDIVKYADAFLVFLTNGNSNSDDPDVPQALVMPGGAYVIKWRGIVYTPSPTN